MIYIISIHNIIDNLITKSIDQISFEGLKLCLVQIV